MINLDELKKIAEAATTGPWETKDNGGTVKPMKSVHATYEMDDGEVNTCMDWIIGYMQVSNCPNYREDANFIAAFNPAVALELIAKLRKARLALEDVASRIAKREPQDLVGITVCLAEMGDGEK